MIGGKALHDIGLIMYLAKQLTCASSTMKSLDKSATISLIHESVSPSMPQNESNL